MQSANLNQMIKLEEQRERDVANGKLIRVVHPDGDRYFPVHTGEWDFDFRTSRDGRTTTESR